MVLPVLTGLDLLATAVLALDAQLRIRYANPAAENLLELSNRHLPEEPITQVFSGAQALATTAQLALGNATTYVEHDVALTPLGRAQLRLDCTVTPMIGTEPCVLLEFRLLNQQLKAEREQRTLQEGQLNRELIRNLAHEIRNPLGGIRGAAQLLENELERKDLTEYTRVIIKEADRLQALLDRLLAPNRPPNAEALNVHEVLEQVRSVIRAEFPSALSITRDYDPSLPELHGDKQQLTQAFLNIVRNAAQALQGDAAAPEKIERKENEIVIKTRAARRVTVAKKAYRLALSVQIIDNGPGIAQDLHEKIFFPLFSAREGGTGLGLTIAQSFINQQRGTIEVESAPGRTCFTVMLPIRNAKIE
jgi:two-component system, NtrC family, nitrogen regulation sensor histidine kinase GlnL